MSTEPQPSAAPAPSEPAVEALVPAVAPADLAPGAQPEAAAPAEAAVVADAAAAPAEAPAAKPAAPEMSLGACAREMRSRFPALFGDTPKPIKLRIQADIQERAPGVFSRKILSIFLHRHTTHSAYIQALSRATQRFDLDGQPAGELADEHRLAAVEELKRRRALNEERRAAEEGARRAEDEARRQRIGLLRDFERTTLTRANFCALKGLAEDALDGLLEAARKEAAEWEQRRPPAGERRDERGPRPGQRPAGRGPNERPRERQNARPQGRREGSPDGRRGGGGGGQPRAGEGRGPRPAAPRDTLRDGRREAPADTSAGMSADTSVDTSADTPVRLPTPGE